ncbi:MAG: hypothetical protein IJQ81_07050 [Oscillibacter sp.]|nr:hypothetical protein [Oscillibacter sp.]
MSFRGNDASFHSSVWTFDAFSEMGISVLTAHAVIVISILTAHPFTVIPITAAGLIMPTQKPRRRRVRRTA